VLFNGTNTDPLSHAIYQTMDESSTPEPTGSPAHPPPTSARPWSRTSVMKSSIMMPRKRRPGHQSPVLQSGRELTICRGTRQRIGERIWRSSQKRLSRFSRQIKEALARARVQRLAAVEDAGKQDVVLGLKAADGEAGAGEPSATCW